MLATVRDDAHVNAREQLHQSLGQRRAETAQPAPGTAAAEKYVRGVPTTRDLSRGRGNIVRLFDQQVRPQQRCKLAQGRQRMLLISGEFVLRGSHPEEIQIRAESLRRTPRAANEPLGTGVR